MPTAAGNRRTFSRRGGLVASWHHVGVATSLSIARSCFQNRGLLSGLPAPTGRERCTAVGEMSSGKILDTLDLLTVVVGDLSPYVFPLKCRFHWPSDKLPQEQGLDIHNRVEHRPSGERRLRVTLLERVEIFLSSIALHPAVRRRSEFSHHESPWRPRPQHGQILLSGSSRGGERGAAGVQTTHQAQQAQ